MAQDYIITSFEAKRYSTVGNEFSLGTISKIKKDTEEAFFNDCLGTDLYDEMLEDVKEYPSAITWNNATTYGAGDYAILFDQILESKVAGNTNNNPESDIANEFWKVAAKFDNPAFEDLYTKYLRQLLANLIAKDAGPIDTIKANAKGFTMSVAPDGSGQASADIKTIEYALRRMQKTIDTKIEIMKKWLISEYKKFKANPDEGYDWSIIPFVKSECGEIGNYGSKPRRRFITRPNTESWY